MGGKIMADNRCPSGYGKETVCIDVNRVLDSCKDKDCFSDVKVYLTDFGQDIIDRAGAIRVKSTKIVGVNIDTEPVQFNRGFYQILIRFYVKLVFEACVNVGRSVEFEGIAVCDKKVILYGSEGNVNIFKSCPSCEFCDPAPEGSATTNMPTVVLETVDPIVLSVCNVDKPCCRPCCSIGEIPENVCAFVNGPLCDHDDGRTLYVTLGFFSIVRIERPGQFLVQATEYSVPEKTCPPVCEEDPCSLFEKMAFPINEFSPPSLRC